MARSFKQFGLVAVVAAASLSGIGCSTASWEAIGTRLLDGVSLNVGMDQDGELHAGLGFSTELAARRSQERTASQLRSRLVELALAEEAEDVEEDDEPVLMSVSERSSRSGRRPALTEEEREAMRAMIAEELLRDGWTRPGR